MSCADKVFFLILIGPEKKKQKKKTKKHTHTKKKKKNVEKVGKIYNKKREDNPKKHIHIFRPWQKHLQSFQNFGIKLWGVRPQATHVIVSHLNT